VWRYFLLCGVDGLMRWVRLVRGSTGPVPRLNSWAGGVLGKELSGPLRKRAWGF